MIDANKAVDLWLWTWDNVLNESSNTQLTARENNMYVLQVLDSHLWHDEWKLIERLFDTYAEALAHFDAELSMFEDYYITKMDLHQLLATPKKAHIMKDGLHVSSYNGTKEWYLHNELHREDGPAVDDTHGHREWWLNGELHRVDGPAIEFANGDHAWYLNGEKHRVDGPAIEDVTGYKEWFLDGLRHRADGPAIEDTKGNKEWWVNGIPQHKS
jgi:hypothetical protein